MEIIRAKILGFCAGVRRAVLAADKALSDNERRGARGRVYTLGPLIHNPAALQKLAERDLKILSEDEIGSLSQDDTVIIRAHGVPPETESALMQKKAAVINATCPLVTKSQATAAEHAGKGYVIFFAGDKNHGEVIGIEGCARKAADNARRPLHFILIKDAGELRDSIKSLESAGVLSQSTKIVLLSQTTFSIETFDRLRNELSARFPGAKIISSICPATHERQESLAELCSQTDGVIVIGGKTSANTNRLFRTASKLSRNAALIEIPDEIPGEFFSLKKVGITAGASTPDDIIRAVEERLMSGEDEKASD